MWAALGMQVGSALLGQGLNKLFEEEMIKKQLELEQKEKDLINKEVFRVELEIEREKDYLENQK